MLKLTIITKSSGKDIIGVIIIIKQIKVFAPGTFHRNIKFHVFQIIRGKSSTCQEKKEAYLNFLHVLFEELLKSVQMKNKTC